MFVYIFCSLFRFNIICCYEKEWKEGAGKKEGKRVKSERCKREVEGGRVRDGERNRRKRGREIGKELEGEREGKEREREQ